LRLYALPAPHIARYRTGNAGNARFTAQGALWLNAAAWTSALAARTAINILPLMKQGRE
jgi:hypothetical protein